MEGFKMEIRKTVNKLLKKKRGFTLVEIIVVLVILAILAAFTIPTMLGFVSDAKGKAYIAEAREVYVAAQAVATEYSGVTTLNDGEGGTGLPTSLNDGTSDGSLYYGLTNSLSSTRIMSRHNAWNTPGVPQYNYSRVKASRQMYNYLSQDITISAIDLLSNPNAKPNQNEAAWTVTVGTEPTQQTAKVTKVVYLKNGYRVTIEGNNASVAKW